MRNLEGHVRTIAVLIFLSLILGCNVEPIKLAYSQDQEPSKSTEQSESTTQQPLKPRTFDIKNLPSQPDRAESDNAFVFDHLLKVTTFLSSYCTGLTHTEEQFRICVSGSMRCALNQDHRKIGAEKAFGAILDCINEAKP